MFRNLIKTERDTLLEQTLVNLKDPTKLDKFKYLVETLEHIRDVSTNVSIILKELVMRGCFHDRSKTENPERDMFARYRHAMEGLEYGTPEYDKLKQAMNEDYLYKHYEQNKHHPEYYEGGIRDMDLVDIVEMLCDWISASSNNVDLDKNQEKFKYSDDLKNIFQNTIDRYFKK